MRGNSKPKPGSLEETWSMFFGASEEEYNETEPAEETDEVKAARAAVQSGRFTGMDLRTLDKAGVIVVNAENTAYRWLNDSDKKPKENSLFADETEEELAKKGL